MSMTDLDEGSEAAQPTRLDPEAMSIDQRRTWVTIAGKEIAELARSWQPYVLLAVFGVVITIGSLGPVLSTMNRRGPVETLTAGAGLIRVSSFVGVFLPLVILIGVHAAVVGGRQRGSLRLLLGLPVSRRDVLLGTLLGWGAVYEASLLAGLAVSGVAMYAFYDTMSVIDYLGFSIGVLLFGAIFVSMGIGISAAVRTRGRAVGLAVSMFAVVTFLWQELLALLEALTGASPQINITAPNIAPGWYVFLHRLKPENAWRLVMTEWVVPVLDAHEQGASVYYISYTTSGSEPFYLDTWFLAGVLIAWGIVPLLIGYVRFQVAEIQ